MFSFLVGSARHSGVFPNRAECKRFNCHYMPQYVFLDYKTLFFLIFELLILQRPTFSSRTLILEFLSQDHAHLRLESALIGVSGQ